MTREEMILDRIPQCRLLAAKMARRFKIRDRHPLYSIAEFEAIAILAVCKRVERYKPECGAWSTFCEPAIVGAIIDFVRDMSGSRLLTKVQTVMVGLRGCAVNDYHFASPAEFADPARLSLESLIGNLEGRRREVVDRLLKGETTSEIGSAWNVTEGRVSQIYGDATRKMKAKAMGAAA